MTCKVSLSILSGQARSGALSGSGSQEDGELDSPKERPNGVGDEDDDVLWVAVELC